MLENTEKLDKIYDLMKDVEQFMEDNFSDLAVDSHEYKELFVDTLKYLVDQEEE